MAGNTEYWKQKYLKSNEDTVSTLEELARVNINYSKLLEKSRRQKQKISQLIEQNKTLKASQKVYEQNNEILASTICGTTHSIQQSLFKPSSNSKSPGLRERPQRMFEEFFILGSDMEQNNGLYEVKILEKCPGHFDTSHNVIGNFSFPKGFQPWSVDFTQSGSALYKLLYPKYDRDENSFVFTIKAGDAGTLGFPSMTNNEKEVIYGCCVIKNELLLDGNDTNPVPVHPKCYCLLSYIPCFELHFQVLYSLLSIDKAQSFNGEAAELRATGSMRTTASCLEAEESLLLEEQKGLLDAYYSNNFLNSRTVSIQLQTIPPLKVKLPRDLSTLDTD